MAKPIPDNGDDMSRDIESLHRLVADTEQEKAHRKPKGDVPRDLFGIVSLLPRRLMGAGLVFALMGVSSLATWVLNERNARQQDDGQAVKLLTTVVVPRINERLNSVEIEVAAAKGEAIRRDRELAELAKSVNDLARGQARIEGKLDKALR